MSNEYTSRFYYKGEIIFSEGSSGDTAFLVKDGRVALTREVGDETIPLAELGHGEIFGEMAVFMAGPRTATATMVEAGDLILLPKSLFLRQIEAAPPMVKTMFQSLMERLLVTTDRLRPSHEASLFLGVCRTLSLELERMQAAHERAIPYREALRQVKEILQVSTAEVEEVFFKLHDLGLIVCHKDGIPNKSLVFVHAEGFLGACERYYSQFSDHMGDSHHPEDDLDLADLPARFALDPLALVRMAAEERLPQGILRVSRQALTRWTKDAPESARMARLGGPDFVDAPEPVSAP